MHIHTSLTGLAATGTMDSFRTFKVLRGPKIDMMGEGKQRHDPLLTSYSELCLRDLPGLEQGSISTIRGSRNPNIKKGGGLVGRDWLGVRVHAAGVEFSTKGA